MSYAQRLTITSQLDDQLIMQSQSGCSESMETLLEKHCHQVSYFIRKKIKNKHIAEDLVQDTLFQAHLSITNFRGESRFSTWLLGIANNVIRKYYQRSKQANYQFVDDYDFENQLDEQPLPQQTIMVQQYLSQIDKLIDQLPEATRVTFLSVVVDGLSYREAAEKFETSLQIIKNRVFRARKFIKQGIEPRNLN